MSQKEQEEDSLFNINLSSSEEEFIKEADKVPRGHQSEAHFQRQKAEWKPKIENGEASVFPPFSHGHEELRYTIKTKQLRLDLEKSQIANT